MHTPLTIDAPRPDSWNVVAIRDATGAAVAMDIPHRTAEEIVAVCNSHADLLEACRLVVNHHCSKDARGEYVMKFRAKEMAQIQAAVAKATEKEAR